MATKPGPKGSAGKHGKQAAGAGKHTAAKPAAKHNASNPHAKPAGHPAGHKPPAKHHPAHKPALSPQVQKLVKQEVAKLVKQDVQKALSHMGQHPAKKPAKPATKGKAPAKKPAPKGTAPRGAPIVLDGIPWCPVEALASSLRMTGKAVGADDMLALFDYATGGSGAPTSILAALVAAQHVGLAGAYPTFRWAEVPTDGAVVGVTIDAGPHAVTLDGSGLWTWGEWRPVTRPLEIEEAWVVTWQ